MQHLDILPPSIPVALDADCKLGYVAIILLFIGDIWCTDLGGLPVKFLPNPGGFGFLFFKLGTPFLAADIFCPVPSGLVLPKCI